MDLIHAMTENDHHDLLERIAGDPMFGVTLEELREILKPEKYVGRAPEQTQEFLDEVLGPVLERYRDTKTSEAEVTV